MVGYQLRARARRTTAAVSSGGGVHKERQRPRRGRKREGGAIKREGRAAKPAVDAATVPSISSEQKEIEEGSIDDTGAEYIERLNAYVGSAEEEAKLVQRLLKKRANMGLALYRTSHPDEQHQFLRVVNTVFYFMDYRLEHPAYMHMNFMALDIKTGLEKLFFVELGMINDIYDSNSGYAATACEIVDDNSAGGRKGTSFFRDGRFPPDYSDGENCYACAENIKHPPGASYRAGHDMCGYGV